MQRDGLSDESRKALEYYRGWEKRGGFPKIQGIVSAFAFSNLSMLLRICELTSGSGSGWQSHGFSHTRKLHNICIVLKL
jgi:hypothetical protein